MSALTLYSNFRTPNGPAETDIHGGRSERNRLKNIEWIAYENVHKKYLILGKLICIVVTYYFKLCDDEYVDVKVIEIFV